MVVLEKPETWLFQVISLENNLAILLNKVAALTTMHSMYGWCSTTLYPITSYNYFTQGANIQRPQISEGSATLFGSAIYVDMAVFFLKYLYFPNGCLYFE